MSLIRLGTAQYGLQTSNYSSIAYLDMSLPYAAGALYSTVEDLYLWDQALYTDKVLSKRLRDLAFSDYEDMPDPENKRTVKYGYGWTIERATVPGSGSLGDGDASNSKQLKVVGHGGGINGFNTLIQRIPEDKHLIVLLNNTGATKLGEMARSIMAVLYGGLPKMPREPAAPILCRTYREEGIAAAVRQFGELSEEKTERYDLEWREVDRLGRHLLQKKKTADAIEIFKLNVDSNPQQANVYLGLADAYRQAGNRKLAVQNYSKALELNPDWSDLIANQLKELKAE